MFCFIAKLSSVSRFKKNLAADPQNEGMGRIGVCKVCVPSAVAVEGFSVQW